MLNRKPFIVLLAIVAVLGLCGMSYADSPLVQYSGNGHLYERFDHPYTYGTDNQGPIGFITWHDAQAACAAQGGYLATATSAEENQFIYNNLVYVHGTYSWLGATDEVTEGTFAWVTGEPWSYSNWETMGGEPSDGTACGACYGSACTSCLQLGEDYLAMYAYSGKWYDIGPPMDSWRMAFATADSYVCEFDQGVCQGPNVPGVAGMTQAEAETAIAAAGLVVGAVGQQKSTTTAIGIAISTRPTAGTTVCAGSMAVDLIVSSGVSVPNVAGMTLVQATTAITAAGLVAGAVLERASAVYPCGTVNGQDPAAGTHVNAGSAVSLYMPGGCTPLAVPNVVGMTDANARAAIAGAGLTVGNVTAQNSSLPVGSVISQNPAAGTYVKPGTAVGLRESGGPAACGGTHVPNLTGCLTPAQIEAMLNAAGLVVGVIVQQCSTTVPIGCVIGPIPAPGSCVSPGTAINMVISTGAPVPNVVGMTDVNARAAITGWGLTVGNVTTQPNSTVPVGQVIGQVPAYGTFANGGTAVNLVESSGPLNVQIQTDVTSLTVPEAGTGQIQVRLDRQPPSDIVVSASIVTGDPDIYIFSGATLTFTPSNWATYQLVKIAALPDEDMVDDTATVRLTSSELATVEVPVTETDGGSCASIVNLPDLNGNGAAEFAMLQFNAATSPYYSILVKDGHALKNVKALSISSVLRPVSLATFNDAGTATIVVLERQLNTGIVRCELIDASTGARRAMNFGLAPAFVPKALAILPDMNGNGSQELAVLGVGTDGSVSALVRDSLTGTLIKKVAFGRFQPYAFCAVPSGVASGPELALLYRNKGGLFAVAFRDALSGQLVKTVSLRSDYTPTAMGMTWYPTPPANTTYMLIAVLGFNSANKAAVQLRDASTGAPVQFIPLDLARTSAFIPYQYGAYPSLVLVGAGTSGGLKTELRALPGGGLVHYDVLTGAAVPRGLSPGFDPGGAYGDCPLMVLRLDKSTGATSIDRFYVPVPLM